MIEYIIQEIVDDTGETSSDSRGALLAKIAAYLGLQNASYLAVNLPRRTHREYYVQFTFTTGWAEHYEQQGYVDIDPLVGHGLTGLMPIDWGELRTLSRQQSKMFGESCEFKIGSRGITFPLIGPNNERAILSFMSDLSKREWRDFKREKLGDMRLMASLFHRGVMNQLSDIGSRPAVTLTERERECLRWCAEGKTQEEIASILGITTRTVRYFIDGARGKLNCHNTVQTVVCAMQRGLL